MRTSGLERDDWVCLAGGVALIAGIFLPWYGTSDSNANAMINGERGDFSCWAAHPVLRWLLLLAAIAPFVLAWIIIRGHALSWARGELTAVISLAAIVLILFNGVIDRPGDPAAEISLKWGWFVALAGTAAAFAGSATRASSVERARRPPGTI